MNRLQSILEQYANQAKCNIKVKVTEIGDNIEIRWDHSKGNWNTFHIKEFPKDHLEDRINNYKNKLK